MAVFGCAVAIRRPPVLRRPPSSDRSLLDPISSLLVFPVHEKIIPRDETIRRLDAPRQFGHFGGMFVPETLVHDLRKLDAAFRSLYQEKDFQKELDSILRDYVGRESPLYFAERLTNHYKHSEGVGPQIFLKREDLNHTGAHTINNSAAQALLAKRVGKSRIVADTGSGQHGLSTAAVCARFGLCCVIYMCAKDMEKNAHHVMTMRLLGAEVRAVAKNAASEAMRDMVTNLESTHYIIGSAVGPHPYPTMVREFQAVIGRETTRQAMAKWGRKPDVVLACVGRGSNAIGLFHEFLGDSDVRLIGVEAAGAASLTRGYVGVHHGAMTYLLQDHDGQIIEPRSISSGMKYPDVGPEHGYLKNTGRVEYQSVDDREAFQAFKRLSRLEGIVPALETSHALAYLKVLCPTLPDRAKVVVGCSGSGDKDLHSVIKCLNSDHLLRQEKKFTDG